MVSKDDYLKYCYNADIPIRRSEKKILETITGRMGTFNVERYIFECEKRKIFITKNQMDILKMLPEDNDDMNIFMAKQSELIRMCRRIKESNKYGV